MSSSSPYSQNNTSTDNSSVYNSALDETLNGFDSADDATLNGEFSSPEKSASFDFRSESQSRSLSEAKVVVEQASPSEDQSLYELEDGKFKIYRTIEDFEKNLPSTVTVLTSVHGCKVYLVGTAHFSENSQDDVSLVIRNVQPDVVMVELCPSRVHILRHDEKTLLEEAKDINASKIRNLIKTNGLINGMFYILLLNMSAKITKELGMAPGGEFRRAVEEATRVGNCGIHLGDRPIAITLQRALYGLSLFQTVKLVWKLVTFNEDITQEEVEQCKQKDLLEQLMKEMAGEFPAFGDVFVRERDLYLCHSLQMAALPQKNLRHPTRVVGVVGIGHAQGIVNNWGTVQQAQISQILTIPKASLSNRIFKFTIKYGTLSLLGYGLFRMIRPRIRGIL